MNGTIALLLFISLPMGALFLFLLIRAVRAGQYEDSVTPAMRMLADDEPESRRFPLGGKNRDDKFH